jgi:hypothetical protein
MVESYLAETATLPSIDSKRKAKPSVPPDVFHSIELHLSVLCSSQNMHTTRAFRGTVSIHLYIRMFQLRNQ